MPDYVRIAYSLEKERLDKFTEPADFTVACDNAIAALLEADAEIKRLEAELEAARSRAK